MLTVALAGQTHVLAQEGVKWAIAEPDDRNRGSPMLINPMSGDSHWLALVAGANQWALVPLANAGRDERDPPATSPPGTLVVLKYPALVAGPAHTPEMRFKGQPRLFGPGTPSLRFRFGSNAYEVAVEGQSVWLREGARHMKIGEARDDTDNGDRFRTSLLWAGDLDRDGRLDFIVRRQNGGESDELCLYLSSRTRDDREVADNIACEVWSG